MSLQGQERVECRKSGLVKKHGIINWNKKTPCKTSTPNMLNKQ